MTSLASAIYEGTVHHRRLKPVLHAFEYRVFYMLLDLDELPELFHPYRFWSAEGRALARFRREDHYSADSPSLSESIRDLVENESGVRPLGPVRLLTHLRYFGYCFNPISVYYCFTEDGQLSDMVLEVSNTPWGERHCYVLPKKDNMATEVRLARFSFEKRMHVSPFFPMDLRYVCRATEPAEQLYLGIQCHHEDKKVFDGDLALERKEITKAALRRLLLKYPIMTLQVTAAIHWQAVKLALKRVPFFAHPSTTSPRGSNA